MSTGEREVAARIEEAATLPSWRYTRPEALVEENEKVFGRTWQLVARLDQVAAPGAHVAAQVGSEPLLVVRGEDGALRALSNVCRHRAGPVVREAGTSRVLKCGYHGWSYSLEGRLLGTPEFEGVEGFHGEACALPPFAVDSWIGLVFANLDTGAPALSATLDALAPRLEERGLGSMRLAFRRDWVLDCNWKVYVDNYLEGYHIPIVHPGLMKELDYAAYRTDVFRNYSVQVSPIRGGAGGRLHTTAQSEDAAYYWIYPNLMLNVYPDNFSTNLIVPLGPEKTLTVFEWFFADAERPEVEERVRKTVEFSDEIQREDISICEAVQRGLRSKTYERGRYSVKRESGVHHFHRLYAASMKG